MSAINLDLKTTFQETPGIKRIIYPCSNSYQYKTVKTGNESLIPTAGGGLYKWNHANVCVGINRLKCCILRCQASLVHYRKKKVGINHEAMQVAEWPIK